MKNTTNYGWRYPEPGEHTRTWEYWQVFEDVDGTLHTGLNAANGRLDKLEAPGSFYATRETDEHAPQFWNPLTYDTAWANGSRFVNGQIVIDSPGLWWIFSTMHLGPAGMAGNACGGVGTSRQGMIMDTESPMPQNLPGTAFAGIALDLLAGEIVYGLWGQTASTDRVMTWATLSGFRVGAAGTPPRTAPPVGQPPNP